MKTVKLLIGVCACIWEYVTWCGLLLKTCLFGHHDYTGYTDGKRIIFVCSRCMKRIGPVVR